MTDLRLAEGGIAGARKRHRQVSPQRIARVAEALGGRCRGVQLQTDGSAIILTDERAIPLSDAQAPNPWDEVLPGAA